MITPQECDEILSGLKAPRKRLSPKFFYDARGSDLFEKICGTPEYTLTRTEVALLRQVAPELRGELPRGATLIEWGSGSSVKTEVLLQALDGVEQYIPIDVSRSALEKATDRIRRDHPRLRVHPLLFGFHPRVRGRGSPGGPGSALGLPARLHAREF